MQAPARITRIALRGFDEEAKQAVRQRFEAEGFEVVFSTRTADCVICPADVSEQILAQLRTQNTRVNTVEEFFARQTAARAPQAPSIDSDAEDAFVVHDDWVRILDVQLPRRARMADGVPPAELFRQLCYDRALMLAARQVALAAVRGIPCALEGETAASKTTAVHLVAHWSQRPVIRLNLNGQTDTSELVGRFVPSTAEPDIHPEDIAKHAELLPKNLQKMVTAARICGQFTEIERAVLAKEFGLKAAAWRFVEGPIPRAMREGAWVVLDEMNLAEPQVLERLNPALEDPPSLTLSEGNGVRFGKNGDVPVHNDFRLFATLNPAEYAGRSVLSPAYRDRWRLWHHVSSPQQTDLWAMLRALVYGEQPSFLFQGRLYRAPATIPVYKHLQNLPNIANVLERIAMFHWSVASAAGEGGQAARLGRTRRERSLFSRRLLLTLLDLWDAALDTKRNAAVFASVSASPMEILSQLIETLYVERIPDTSDRDAVLAAMQAAHL